MYATAEERCNYNERRHLVQVVTILLHLLECFIPKWDTHSWLASRDLDEALV